MSYKEKSLDHKLYLASFGFYHLTEEDKLMLVEREKIRFSEYFKVIANLHRATPLSLTWFKLLRVDYRLIVGPLEAQERKEWQGMSTLDGFPEFEVKELDGKFYNFRGLPNPGFPGS